MVLYKIRAISEISQSQWSDVVEIIEEKTISYAAVYDNDTLVLNEIPITENIPNTFTCEEHGTGYLVEYWLDIENTSGQLWSKYAPTSAVFPSDPDEPDLARPIMINSIYILNTISPKSTHKWFYAFDLFDGFYGLEKIDMSKCVDSSYMFGDISHCSDLNLNDLSNWDMSNVKDMSYMFYHYQNWGELYTYGDISNWDTSSCEDMSYMFWWVQREEGDQLDLSNWDVSNVKKHDNFIDYRSNPSYPNNNQHIICPNWVD